jgi:elongation factor 1-alpha
MTIPIQNIHIAVSGSVDAGKSSLIGVLTTGILDNGKGLSRSEVFVHPHEKETGRTSCISYNLIGFKDSDNVYGSWPYIVENSNRLITLIDTCGHAKYLRSTINALSVGIDYCIVIIASNGSITKMTKEHIIVCLSYKIPIIVLVTKIDICPDKILIETINNIKKLFKSVNKSIYELKEISDINENTLNKHIIPLIKISNVTGHNFPILNKFLNSINPTENSTENSTEQLLIVVETFSVKGVGTVVHTFLKEGSVKINDILFLGPFYNGEYIEVRVRSLHYKRIPVETVNSRNFVCLGIKSLSGEPIRKRVIKRGMVLTNNPLSIYNFNCDINILNGTCTINKGYEPVIHIEGIQQCAEITNMNSLVIRSGDSCKLGMKFKIRPVFIKKGDRFIFREGTTRGIGIVNSID